jgi:hypothetical protein
MSNYTNKQTKKVVSLIWSQNGAWTTNCEQFTLLYLSQPKLEEKASFSSLTLYFENGSEDYIEVMSYAKF